MRKLIYAIAALGALAWSGAAWAVLQETTITLTDNGRPLPEATITLNRITDSQPPPEPKTEKTDDSGKIVLVHEEEDKTSDKSVDVIVTTSEGKTFIRRIVLHELLTGESIDVAAPSVNECIDLTNLDDEQLRIIINDPNLRTRISRLIEETEQTEEVEEKEGKTSETTSAHESKETTSSTGKGKSKEKKVVKRKEQKHPTASDEPASGARNLLGTGLAIGMGIAGSRGHGKGHHGEHSKGMGGTGGMD
jgi:hypothetical protein